MGWGSAVLCLQKGKWGVERGEIFPIQTQEKSSEAPAVISVCGSYRLACYSQKILLSRSITHSSTGLKSGLMWNLTVIDAVSSQH